MVNNKIDNINLMNLINSLKDIFSSRLISIILYGSKAKQDTLKKENNINLLVLIENLTPDDLKKSTPIVKIWLKKKNPLPLFIDNDEWYDSVDIYPIEYSDLIDSYKILYGRDCLIPLEVEKKNLRLQTELELKKLFMYLKENYLLYSDNENQLEKTLLISIKKFLIIFRAILRLNNDSIPDNNLNIIEKVSLLGLIEKSLWEKLINYKNKKIKISRKDISLIYNAFIKESKALLKYVNDFKNI